MGAVAEAVHDPYPHLRRRRGKDALHRARPALDGGRSRNAREDGVPPGLGHLHRPARSSRRQALTRETGMANNFVWYELMTSDAKAAQDFYAKVVGWKPQDSGQTGIDYTLLLAGGVPMAGLM